MATTNEGWEDRYTRIKAAIRVHLPNDKMLYALEELGLITRAEVDRSLWKIALLEPFVTRMMLNMIKGTIKYPTDDWTTDMWDDMSMDDQADSVNYNLLFKDYLRKEEKL